MLLVLLHYDLLRALWKIDVYLISTLVNESLTVPPTMSPYHFPNHDPPTMAAYHDPYHGPLPWPRNMALYHGLVPWPLYHGPATMAPLIWPRTMATLQLLPYKGPLQCPLTLAHTMATYHVPLTCPPTMAHPTMAPYNAPLPCPLPRTPIWPPYHGPPTKFTTGLTTGLSSPIRGILVQEKWPMLLDSSYGLYSLCLTHSYTYAIFAYQF